MGGEYPFEIAYNLKASIHEHWDAITSSRDFSFRRMLKEVEALEFQPLLGCLAGRGILDYTDSRCWSLDPSGKFSVKSQSK